MGKALCNRQGGAFSEGSLRPRIVVLRSINQHHDFKLEIPTAQKPFTYSNAQHSPHCRARPCSTALMAVEQVAGHAVASYFCCETGRSHLVFSKNPEAYCPLPTTTTWTIDQNREKWLQTVVVKPGAHAYSLATAHCFAFGHLLALSLSLSLSLSQRLG